MTVLTAPDILAELARDLALVDLVPVVDAALRATGLTPDEVLAAVRPRTHGLPGLRRALLLADDRSESYWESVLRLLHVLAGITCVEPQVEVGDRVARGDLWLVGTRRIVEYDGAGHRDHAQHARDLHRDKALLRIAWERDPYVAREIVSSPGRIMRDAEEALGFPHDVRRLRRWLAQARVSTLTASGRARLAGRPARTCGPPGAPTGSDRRGTVVARPGLWRRHAGATRGRSACCRQTRRGAGREAVRRGRPPEEAVAGGLVRGGWRGAARRCRRTGSASAPGPSRRR